VSRRQLQTGQKRFSYSSVRKTHFTGQKTTVYIVCSLLHIVLRVLCVGSVISKFFFVHVTLALHELI
jgi:hypothetical protein